MLHDEPVPSADHSSAERDRPSAAESIPKKRHSEPDHFERAGQILQVQRGHLHVPAAGHLDSSEHHACYRTDLSFTYLSDGDRILEYLICPRIVTDQISHSAHADLFKKLFCLFTDSFQLTDL